MNTYDEFEFDALESASNYRKWIKDYFKVYLKGDVVEVGAGIGQNSREYIQIGNDINLTCIEPEKSYIQRLKKNVPNANIINGTIDNLPITIIPTAIISINVLEHIEKDVDEMIKYKDRLQAAGGAFCLLVPARQEIYSPIDKTFGHYRRYSKSELQDKLRYVGFTKVSLRYINLIGYFSWLIKFKLLRSKRFTKEEVNMFDQYIIPINRILEKRFEPPIGQSIICIASP